MNTKAHKFFFEHQIFTFAQFAKAMANPISTCRVMLNQHLNSGNITHIKQGLYAYIPSGANPEKYPVDPYTIIAALAPDAIVAYHSALQFHGFAYTLYFQHVYLSTLKIRDFQFRQERFKVTGFPKSLPKERFLAFTNTIDHHGFMVKVTNVERTLVDVLHRINLSGGLEEIWRSINNISKINMENVIEYCLLLNNSTTTAKLGLYLRLRQQEWQINELHFTTLKKHLSKSIHYFERDKRKHGKYVKEWHLVVPPELLGETWEELFDIEDI